MPEALSSPTPLFTNAAGAVLAHPAGYAIVRYQNGPWQAADLAALLTHLGQLLLQRDWHYCLADASHMPTLSAESKAWLEKNWLGTSALRPQPLHMALVQPGEVFSRLAVAQMQAQNHGSTHYTYFSDEAAAHEYLRQQLAKPKEY